MGRIRMRQDTHVFKSALMADHYVGAAEDLTRKAEGNENTKS